MVSLPSATPPATPEKQPPATVAKVREMLAAKEVPFHGISPQQLYQEVVATSLNVLASGFRNNMAPKVKEEFMALSSQEKRDWISQYLVDPFAGLNHGFTRTMATDSRHSVGTVLWLTEAQLASPTHLNYASQAKTLVDSNSLPQRDHEEKTLALLGVKQYEYVVNKVVRKTGWQQEAGT